MKGFAVYGNFSETLAAEIPAVFSYFKEQKFFGFSQNLVKKDGFVIIVVVFAVVVDGDRHLFSGSFLDDFASAFL